MTVVSYLVDIAHPQMNQRIHKPRIVLLDCPLEYKNGESRQGIEGDGFCVSRSNLGGASQRNGGLRKFMWCENTR